MRRLLNPMLKWGSQTACSWRPGSDFPVSVVKDSLTCYIFYWVRHQELSFWHIDVTHKEAESTSAISWVSNTIALFSTQGCWEKECGHGNSNGMDGACLLGNAEKSLCQRANMSRMVVAWVTQGCFLPAATVFPHVHPSPLCGITADRILKKYKTSLSQYSVLP